MTLLASIATGEKSNLKEAQSSFSFSSNHYVLMSRLFNEIIFNDFFQSEEKGDSVRRKSGKHRHRSSSPSDSDNSSDDDGDDVERRQKSMPTSTSASK